MPVPIKTHTPSPRLCPGFLRIIFKIDIQPNRACQAEEVHKEDSTDGNQRPEGSGSAPPEDPVYEQDEQDTEPGGKNIGDEHGAEIKPWFWHKVLLTMRALIFHIEGLIKAERAGIEQIFFVALGAFQAKDTVAFCSFFENAHVNYKFWPARPAGLNEF